ncbi:RWD domain-containing protein [Dendrothele bispora CBS 962.96]|uniref:RWD domain-containing protein n=1 Tax=Dendrothele bispora (strain CBS 962.96) TaxID=1314807 RepID=A0A4S8LN70_DENBC|nr:RWD domain-containing protein [Dendrothele bispora CBS 962.96]
MMSSVLLEEFEVLESIYPTELTKTSERDIQIDVEPEDLPEGEETLKLRLHVHYMDDYPDTLPELSLDSLGGEVDASETAHLINELKKVGDENLGMAMTFTLVSHLREQLSELVRFRTEKRKKDEMERERLAMEEEEARTRGTPVTVVSFKAWKNKFDAEQAAKKSREEEEKLKGFTPKEREEYKKVALRLSGRQLFERNRNLEEDALMEEGTVSVDISQYERTRDNEKEDDNDVVTFSDSD